MPFKGLNLDHPESGKTLDFAFILLLASATGYISLSQEILWMRAVSYATGGRAEDFAYVLGFFLLGVALGAYVGKKICEDALVNPLIFIASMLSISSLIYYLSIPISAELYTLHEIIGKTIAFFFVAFISFLIGGIFPVLCHIGIGAKDSVGTSVSWIYLANILGATTGPLLTGFVMMDKYTLEDNILYLSLATLILSAAVWLISPVSRYIRIGVAGGAICGLVALFLIHDTVFFDTLAKIHFKTKYPGLPYKYVIQNRAGIVVAAEWDTDVVYGGGVYDGMFNTDPIIDTNGIRRAYMVAALHPNPEEVLEIGLSSGSWSRVIANHNKVKKLTIVEINPGYLDLIQNYPESASVLNDPKIKIHIDDGRRWLNRHSEARFDVIVMNTTFHWRSFAANLLSTDFFQLCKRHLKPGGIIYYNTTGSEDAAYTATQVFRFVTRYDSFIAASDSPFEMTREEKLKNLLRFQSNGRPYFDSNNPYLQNIVMELASADLSDQSDILRGEKGLKAITDDNMASEYKSWYRPQESWFNYFQKTGQNKI
jgi:spermidine synthase